MNIKKIIKYIAIAVVIVVAYKLFGMLKDSGFAHKPNVVTFFYLVGGLGIFLFGIKFMGDGLKSYAGDRLKDLIQKYTNNPVKGVFVGMLSTVAIQSSSGTTALTIGLVRSGLMTFRQAIGVIMGANIGTTITAVLIGLKISDYSLPIMAVGGIVYMFTNKNKTKHLAEVIFGFGALFLGLEFMGDALKPIAENPMISDAIVTLGSNRYLAVLVGTVFTMVIQSSSAFIGIIQELYGEGSISIHAAIPLTLGSNIGTTITALLAAIGGSVAAKRASLFHVVFNVVGAIIFTILLSPYLVLILKATGLLNLNPEMQIAFAHGIFNIVVTLLFLPFVKYIEIGIKKLIRSKESEIDTGEALFNKDLAAQSPSLALVQATKSIAYLGRVVERNMIEAKEFLIDRKLSKLEDIYQLETIIDSFESQAQTFLQLIASDELSEKEAVQHKRLLMTAKSYERVGDHLINLIDFTNILISNNDYLDEKAFESFTNFYDLAIEITHESIELLETEDIRIAIRINELEEIMDCFEEDAIDKHFDRLRAGEAIGVSGGIFVDMLNNIERMGDHCNTIANTYMDVNKPLMNLNMNQVSSALE